MMRAMLFNLGALTSAARAMVMPATNVSSADGDCSGDCLMMKMMEEKRVHFAECHAESKLTHGAMGCPTILPSTSASVPCEESKAVSFSLGSLLREFHGFKLIVIIRFKSHISYISIRLSIRSVLVRVP